MYCVKKIKNDHTFREIDILINNIDSFDNYLINKNNIIQKKNQLFNKIPPFSLIKNIFYNLINKELDDDIFFQFSKKNLENKEIMEKIEKIIPDLKIYYLKCKHEKYLENLNEKKIVTIFRQILKPYNFNINSSEKYNNGKKYLLYTLEKNKNKNLKKIESTINFD
jgi:hypothetical protein